ncbi:MAG: hypothetical protein ABI417_12475 [Coleofasciculaceae cyanobacterium]
MKIGIGIASDLVALGIPGSKDGRTFTDINHNINLAARMESQARLGEILADDNTSAKLGDIPVSFVSIALSFKEIAELLLTYS